MKKNHNLVHITKQYEIPWHVLARYGTKNHIGKNANLVNTSFRRVPRTHYFQNKALEKKSYNLNTKEMHKSTRRKKTFSVNMILMSDYVLVRCYIIYCGKILSPEGMFLVLKMGVLGGVSWVGVPG